MLTKSKLINVYTLISKKFLKVKLKSVHINIILYLCTRNNNQEYSQLKNEGYETVNRYQSE